jgi:hypothetical protein
VKQTINYAVCPECGSDDVWDRGNSSTYVGYIPFIDDQGRTHHHDDNCKNYEFICDKCCRRWSETVQNRCDVEGCDWRGKTECNICGYHSVMEEASIAKLKDLSGPRVRRYPK